MSSPSDIQQILVLDADRLCGAVLARTVSTIFPSARVYCESAPNVAASLLAEESIDFLVVSVRGFDLDVITLLSVWSEREAPRAPVLVVTPDAGSTAVVAVRTLPVGGIFDSSSSDLREFEAACHLVASGSVYLSPAALKLDLAAAPIALPRMPEPAPAERPPGRGAPPNDRVRRALRPKNGRW